MDTGPEWPLGRLPIRVELAFGADPAGDPAGWQWIDVGPDRVLDQGVTITSGRADESSEAQPASADVELDNPDGHLTPGHPASPWYPHIRLGTPARISVRAGGPYLRVPPGQLSRASSDVADQLDVSALDVRIDMALDVIPSSWSATPPDGLTPHAHAHQEIAGRYRVEGDQRSWRLLLDPSGHPQLDWSEDGTDQLGTATATEAVPYRPGERFALCVVLHPDDGHGGHEARWYTGRTLSGPWRLLGQPVTGEGVTSIYPADAPLEVPDMAELGYPGGAGRYYGMELRDGPGGELVAAPHFSSLTPDATTEWTDTTGLAWHLVGGAEITDWRTRLVGHVAEWSPQWPYGDLSHTASGHLGEARVGVTISGVLRRMGQGAPQLRSALARRIPHYQPAAYWPMEDGIRALWAASGLDGEPPLALRPVDWEQDDTLPGSAPLPTLEAGAWMQATVPAQGTGEWRVEWLLRIPQDWPTAANHLIHFHVSGEPWTRWVLLMTSNALQLVGFNDDVDPPESDLLVEILRPPRTGKWLRYRVYGWHEDGQAHVRVSWSEIGGTGLGGTVTYDGDVGDVTLIDTTFGAQLEDSSIGHLAVLPQAISAAYDEADIGIAGEPAITRVRRLAQEEGVSVSAPGDPGQSTAMGPQGVSTLLELLQECAAADGGILTERSTVAGLHYSPRHLLYGQSPAIRLDAQTSEIADPLAPTLDDQQARNVVTVSRDGGSSATVSDPESVQHIGRYEDSITLSLAEDEQAEQLAAWHLHRGTWPGMRYPEVTTDLAVAPQRAAEWMDAAPGARLLVEGLPPQHHGPVDVLAEGLTEEITPVRWSVTAACSPWGPWEAGEIAPPDDEPPEAPVPTHVDTAGSELDMPADADGAELRVLTMVDQTWVTTAGPAPTADPGDMPVDVQVGGEVMRVTGIEPAAWDTYDREVTGGWGTSGSGHEWQLAGGAPEERAVAGGSATVTLADDPGAVRVQLLQEEVEDGEVAVTVSVDQVAAGAPLYPALVVRYSGDTYYRVRLALDTSGSVWVQLVQDSDVLEQVQTAYTYEPGTRLRMRMRMDGERITGTVWHADTPMPPPQLEAEAEARPGAIGAAFSSAGGDNTGTAAEFSALEVSTPQRFTAERSVNGVSKSHPAGADLRLAGPIIIAL